MSTLELTIGEVFEVKGGKRLPKGSSFAIEKTKHPYLRVVDFFPNGLKVNNVKYISPDIHDRIKRYTISKEDVYISIAGTIGVAGIVPENYDGANLTENAAKLVCRKEYKVYNRYLSYYLNSPEVQNLIKAKTMAVGVPKLALFRLEGIPFIYPPLATQKKIAELLDTADTLRQKDKALVEKYNQLTQSLFLEMFGSLKENICPLQEACIINPKKAEISTLDDNTVVSFVPMAKVSDTGNVDLSESRKLKEVWNGFTYFTEGDVVFAKITPCMENGKGAVMKKLENGIGFGTTEFHVLRPKASISTSPWIYHLTMMPFFRKEAENNMTGSAGQRRVPTDFLKNYKIAIPPIELQNKFASMVEEIEKQKQLAEETLQKSEALSNSLLQKAFKGELV